MICTPSNWTQRAPPLFTLFPVGHSVSTVRKLLHRDCISQVYVSFEMATQSVRVLPGITFQGLCYALNMKIFPEGSCASLHDPLVTLLKCDFQKKLFFFKIFVIISQGLWSHLRLDTFRMN